MTKTGIGKKQTDGFNVRTMNCPRCNMVHEDLRAYPLANADQFWPDVSHRQSAGSAVRRWTDEVNALEAVR